MIDEKRTELIEHFIDALNASDVTVAEAIEILIGTMAAIIMAHSDVSSDQPEAVLVAEDLESDIFLAMKTAVRRIFLLKKNELI